MSVSRLFRRALSSATAAITTSSAASSIRAINFDLFRERNLKRLVEKFKKHSSELYRFRANNVSIYDQVVRLLAAAQRFNDIEEILEAHKSYPEFSTEGFAVRILTLYGKVGMFENARKVFDEMPQRNISRSVMSFNALLGACVNSKKFDMVEKLVDELPEELCIELDVVSYNIMIKAFCEMGSFHSAVSMIDLMEKKGVEPDVISFNTILDCLYGNGRFSEAEKMWGKVAEKKVVLDIRSYNAKLLGLALEKKTKEGVQLIEEVKNVGLKPNVFSFNALIKGCVKANDLDETKRWYGGMEKSGIVGEEIESTDLGGGKGGERLAGRRQIWRSRERERELNNKKN